VRLACLAPPEALHELQARLSGWRRAHPSEHSRVTGPWPPFSFTREAESP
jgi:hypothetical protein